MWCNTWDSVTSLQAYLSSHGYTVLTTIQGEILTDGVSIVMLRRHEKYVERLVMGDGKERKANMSSPVVFKENH